MEQRQPWLTARHVAAARAVVTAMAVASWIAAPTGETESRAAARSDSSADNGAPGTLMHRRSRTRHYTALPSRGGATVSRSRRLGGAGCTNESFLRETIEISARIGCRPHDLLAVMMRESGLRADAQNGASRAVGLLQFLPGTLESLGWNGTPESFRALDAREQLPWVERFLSPSSQYGLGSAARVYQAVFMPASLRLPASGQTVLIDRRGINANRYRRNRALDFNGDGKITVMELQQAVELSCRTAAWQEVESRLTELHEGGSALPAAASVSSNSYETEEAQTSEPVRGLSSPHGGLAPDSQSLLYRDSLLRQGEDAATIDLQTTAGLMRGLKAVGFHIGQVSLLTAVRGFQWRVGLPTDGVAGSRTRAALATALSEAGVPATL